MNGWFQTWWLARGTAARQLAKVVLNLVVIFGLLLFLSFNLHGEGSAEKGLKTRITVGSPTPWIVWEKFNSIGISSVPSGSQQMVADSHVDIFTSSFAAGALAIYSLDLLFRIACIEKKEREEKKRP